MLEANSGGPRIPCPEPGIYEDVPAETYHAWEAASNSALTKLQRSPAHCRAALDCPREDTPATVRGDALHLAMLDPTRFGARYVAAGFCCELVKSGARTGAPCNNPGKVFRAGAWRCSVHDRGESEDSRVVLSPDDWRTCEAMQAAVRSHPRAAELLACADHHEVSVVFHWPGTSILCKARIDIGAFEAGVIGDLKTTTDASVREFERSVYRYGYHRQAPFYQAACEVHGIRIHDSLLVPVEADPPHGVGVYRITDEAVQAGRRDLAGLLETWQRCTESGVWPCYSDHIIDIGLPAYAWSAL